MLGTEYINFVLNKIENGDERYTINCVELLFNNAIDYIKTLISRKTIESISVEEIDKYNQYMVIYNMIVPLVSKKTSRMLFITSNILEELFELHYSDENAKKVESYMPQNLVNQFELYYIIIRIILWSNDENPKNFIILYKQEHTNVGALYGTSIPFMLTIFNEVAYKFEKVAGMHE